MNASALPGVLTKRFSGTSELVRLGDVSGVAAGPFSEKLVADSSWLGAWGWRLANAVGV